MYVVPQILGFDSMDSVTVTERKECPKADIAGDSHLHATVRDKSCS